MKMKNKIYPILAIFILISVAIFWRDVSRFLLFLSKNEVYVYNFYCSEDSDNCVTVVGKSSFEVNPDTSYYFYEGKNIYIPYFDKGYIYYIEHTGQFCIDIDEKEAYLYTDEIVQINRTSDKISLHPYTTSACID